MKYKVETREVWINRYYVEAKNEEEAKNLILFGDFKKDYEHVNKTERGLPLTFHEFLKVKIIKEKK